MLSYFRHRTSKKIVEYVEVPLARGGTSYAIAFEIVIERLDALVLADLRLSGKKGEKQIVGGRYPIAMGGVIRRRHVSGGRDRGC
jgi:hypothetical protein